MSDTMQETPGVAQAREKMVARMRVAVRIRPPLPREVQDGKFLSCVGVGPTTEKGQTIFINSSDKPVIMSSNKEAPSGGGKISRYTFDKIFAPNLDQERVYSFTMEPLVQAIMDGYNATVLAYGQTGSGKTHTILGEGDGDLEGLTGRAVRNIISDTRVSEVRLSVVQVYQDTISDLLSQTPGESLTVRNSYEGVKVDCLTETKITNVKEFKKLLNYALKKRAVGGTLMNEVSSRSHMIIIVIVRTGNGLAKLNLVDLAGSERLQDSQAKGQRLQETCSINSSLFALVAVVESLSSGKTFVPYRNSKLTQILSDSIGGRGEYFAIT